MALPSAEQLSRWTVTQVTNWLAQCSLSIFRDQFINDGVDGSKLMKLTGPEIDQRYSSVPLKKRITLKDHLDKVKSSRQPPQWSSNPPPLPDRRQPMPPPSQSQPDADNESDEGGWSDGEFDDDDIDYLEPTTINTAAPSKPSPHLNGQRQPLPPPPPTETEETYEIPVEDLQKLQHNAGHSGGLERKGTIVDRLKNELAIRQLRNNAADESEAVAPPPRPPRANHPPPSEPAFQAPPKVQQHTRNAPAPTPAPVSATSDETYEVVEDEKREREQPKIEQQVPSRQEQPLPPRPTKAQKMPPLPPGGWLHQESSPAAVTEPPSPSDDLSYYPWYHGKIGRDAADRMFNKEKKDGMFLVRKSERDPGQPYTLVLWYDRIWNIPIRRLSNGKFAAGKYKEGETQFSSIHELVEHFKTVSLNLKSNNQVEGSHKLTEPAPKRMK